MKDIISWNSREHRRDVKTYFVISALFFSLLVIMFFVLLITDWNNSGTLFDMNDIFCILFFGMFDCFFLWLAYHNLRMAYEVIKFTGNISLIVYSFKDVTRGLCDVDNDNVVFADKDCVVTCDSKENYDILTTLYTFKSAYDFQEFSRVCRVNS